MNYPTRVALALLLAYLSADFMVDGVYWAAWNLTRLQTIPWGERGHAALPWICGFLAFGVWLKELPRLPRLALALIAAYYSTGPVAEGVFWTLDSVLPAEGAIRTYLYGFCALMSYVVWFGLLRRVPKLTWLL